jgi:hypothetical protein
MLPKWVSIAKYRPEKIDNALVSANTLKALYIEQGAYGYTT